MFTAFDRVAHTQYELYATYAEMNPGEDSKRIAEDILNAGWTLDAELKTVNEALRSFAGDSKTYPCEYNLFAIRSADGAAWDIYFLADDSVFLDSRASVDGADVQVAALAMAANWRNLSAKI